MSVFLHCLLYYNYYLTIVTIHILYICRISGFAIQTEYLEQLIMIMLCVNSCVKTFKFQTEGQECNYSRGMLKDIYLLFLYFFFAINIFILL